MEQIKVNKNSSYASAVQKCSQCGRTYKLSGSPLAILAAETYFVCNSCRNMNEELQNMGYER